MKSIIPWAILFLIGCTDEVLDYPNATGDVQGYVRLKKADGTRLTTADVSVRIIGRTNRSTHTSENGRFHFGDLPAGSYELQVDHPGYDSYKPQGIAHLGGTATLLNTPDQPIVLAETPTYLIEECTIDFLVTNDPSFLGSYLRVRVDVNESNFLENPSLVVFVASKPGVSPANYEEVFSSNGSLDAGGADEFSAGFYMFGHRLIEGRTYYARVYPYNGATTYVNPENGRIVFPSLGTPTDEISFIK